MTDLYRHLPPPPLGNATGPTADEARRRRPHPVLGVGLVLLLGSAGAAGDLAFRSGPATVSTAMFLLVLGVGGLLAARAENATGWLLAVAGMAVALWLPIRTSPWLIPLDVVAASVLIVGAAGYARRGSVVGLTFTEALRRLGRSAGTLAAAPVALVDSIVDRWRDRRPSSSGRGPELTRGIVLALPFVVVLGLLLASADAVFASFFRLPVDPPSLLGHVGLAVIGACLAMAVLLGATAAPESTPPPRPRLLGPVEAGIVLGGLVGLYTLFAAAQVVAALGGADHVLETAGLTYAEYARRGFFQLLAVAALTMVTLIALRGLIGASTGRARRVLVLLGESAVALTLVIVAVALRRLALYDDVFGLTMLRLSSTVFAWWIGGVFLLVGLTYAGLGRRRDWLATGIATLALLTLLGYNALDPEALVVRHNVARVGEPVAFDDQYASNLSDDAIPTLVDSLPALDPATAARTIDAICADGGGDGPGLFDWNLSRDRAVEARASIGC